MDKGFGGVVAVAMCGVVTSTSAASAAVAPSSAASAASSAWDAPREASDLASVCACRICGDWSAEKCGV